MVGIISPHIIEEIRNRVDIVELISRYVPLRAKGKNHYGLCPFHSEKTPSFAVNPDKRIFHCFGCGEGGDIFAFLIKKEGLNFAAAVEFLAGQCGVTIPQKEQSSQELRRLEDLRKIYRVNELAASFFQKQLLEEKAAAQARSYLEQRDISGPTRERFQLGYALPAWEGLFQYLRGQGAGTALIEKSGLCVPRQNRDGCYDRFRDRVMFPIYDHRRRLIGFGGRTLDERANPPKYLNSPETPVYRKGESFYGLNWSQAAVRESGRVLVVEGYLDFIALQQAGVDNVVASLGTAFTSGQARLLEHYAREAVLFFDADEAGIKAALRCYPIFIQSKMRVRVASLPPGEDPDSYVRRHGAQGIRDLAERALSLVDFVVKEAVKNVDVRTVEGQVEGANRVLPLLAQIPGPVERSAYLGKIAQRLNIKEQLLFRELEKGINKKQRSLQLSKEQLESVRSDAERLAQEQILSIMLREEEFLLFGRENLSGGDFSDPGCLEVFELLRRIPPEEVEEASALLYKLKSEEAKNFVTRVFFREEKCEDPRRVFQDCVKTLGNYSLKRRLQELRVKALNDEKALREYNELAKRLKC